VIDFRDKKAPGWKPYTPEEAARYKAYIAWRRLTDNGHRKRDEMSPSEQAEYDRFGFRKTPPMTPAEAAEAKRLYEELTGRSVPESAAST
jgi:hypothetical protein